MNLSVKTTIFLSLLQQQSIAIASLLYNTFSGTLKRCACTTGFVHLCVPSCYCSLMQVVPHLPPQHETLYLAQLFIQGPQAPWTADGFEVRLRNNHQKCFVQN